MVSPEVFHSANAWRFVFKIMTLAPDAEKF